MIKTGFKSLDNLIDLNKAGVTILTGIGFANMLSGDIANNICLGQDKKLNQNIEMPDYTKLYC